MIKAILCCRTRLEVAGKSACHQDTSGQKQASQMAEKEEAKRLIDECPEPLKSVVKFALATGLRKSNIINLEWQQIDMQRRVAWGESRREQIKPRHWCGAERYRL